MNEHNLIEQTIHSYASRLDIKEVGDMLDTDEYVIAGGALQKDEPNDFDIYVCDGIGFDLDKITDNAEEKRIKVLSLTQNAATVKIGNYPVQFCRYSKTSTSELIKSFDFAHCQVAVEVCRDKSREIDWHLGDVFYTPDWETARLASTTYYCGYDLPVSSLVRCGKFLKQGKFACLSTYRRSMLAIVCDIIKRGFNDESDFRNQLSAISESIEETDEALELFDLLCHKEVK